MKNGKEDTTLVLLKNHQSVTAMSMSIVDAYKSGEYDPLTLHINLTKIEEAVKRAKADKDVLRITMDELEKYGKNERTFGDCSLSISEGGVKYDYTLCGDDQLEELNRMREQIDQAIKERQDMLKKIPVSGMVDPDTGAMVYPPARSSKTVIRTSFKKCV